MPDSLRQHTSAITSNLVPNLLHNRARPWRASPPLATTHSSPSGLVPYALCLMPYDCVAALLQLCYILQQSCHALCLMPYAL